MFRVGAWLWALTVDELGVDRILEFSRAIGITDLFLLTKSIRGTLAIETLKSVAKASKSYGVDIHSWIVCFEDMSRGRVSPEDGDYVNYLLRLVEDIVSIDGLKGVHLDYVRYRGGAYDRWKYVSAFVEKVKEIVTGYGLTLSIASKAEDYSSREAIARSALYYGQNYEDLARYVDLFIPMTYYLDYGVEPIQAVQGAVWVKEITGKRVYMGIQLHPSENPRDRGRIPSVEEIEIQLRKARELGLDGICFFRFRYLFDRSSELKHVLEAVRY